MIEGRITKLNLGDRTAVLVEENGNEIQVRFTERVNVEIAEDETMGMMGGELEDIEEGYTVEMDLADAGDDGIHRCDLVVCIS